MCKLPSVDIWHTSMKVAIQWYDCYFYLIQEGKLFILFYEQDIV